MKKQKMITVNVPADSIHPDAQKAIELLEKKIKNLENKLKRRDEQIASIKIRMDLSKETRERICDLADQLVSELKEANWVEFDDEDRVY